MSTLLAMTLDEAFNIVNASLGIPDDERSRELRHLCEPLVVRETRPFFGAPELFVSQARAPLRTEKGAYVRAVSLALLAVMVATAEEKSREVMH